MRRLIFRAFSFESPPPKPPVAPPGKALPPPRNLTAPAPQAFACPETAASSGSAVRQKASRHAMRRHRSNERLLGAPQPARAWLPSTVGTSIPRTPTPGCAVVPFSDPHTLPTCNASRTTARHPCDESAVLVENLFAGGRHPLVRAIQGTVRLCMARAARPRRGDRRFQHCTLVKKQSFLVRSQATTESKDAAGQSYQSSRD